MNINATSEDLGSGKIRKRINENYSWIKSNLHLLDEQTLSYWESFNKLNDISLSTGAVFLSSVRSMYDPVYRVQTMGDALLNKITSYDSAIKLQAAGDALKREEHANRQARHNPSEIFISTRHFK